MLQRAKIHRLIEFHPQERALGLRGDLEALHSNALVYQIRRLIDREGGDLPKIT